MTQQPNPQDQAEQEDQEDWYEPPKADFGQLYMFALGIGAMAVIAWGLHESTEQDKAAIEAGLQQCVIGGRAIWAKECK
jgi:hypothetical protein